MASETSAEILSFNSEITQIDITKFTNTIQIGSGGYAKVFSGYHEDYEKVALKELNNCVLPENLKSLKEVQMLIQYSHHPNIVRIIGLLTCSEPIKFYCGYFMEFMEIGSLQNVIYNSRDEYDGKQVTVWIQLVASALQYLHKNGVVHRDIKPANILIGKTLNDLRISDFGLARALNEASHTNPLVGTTVYLAPELLTGECAIGCSTQADIYALCITIFEMIDRSEPFPNYKELSFFQLAAKIRAGERPHIDERKFSMFFQSVNSLSKNEIPKLLRRGWDSDPNKRPTIKEILNFAKKMDTEEKNLSDKPTEQKLKSHFDLFLDAFKSGMQFNASSCYDEYKGRTFTRFYQDEIFPKNDITLPSLSEGSEGAVYQYENRDLGTLAVKLFWEKKGEIKETEKNILLGLEHPSLIRCFGLLYDKRPGKLDYKPAKVVGYVMERAKYSLREVIFKGGPYTLLEAVKWILDVASGLSYLHSQKILHCDIDEQNVLITFCSRAVLCDFGCSVESAKENKAFLIGHPYNVAPEVFDKNRNYSEPVDVYSLGVLFWRLYHRVSNRPSGQTSGGTGAQKRNELAIMIAQNYAIDCDRQLREIFEKCARRQPDKRPTMDNIYSELKQLAQVKKTEWSNFMIERVKESDLNTIEEFSENTTFSYI